MTQTRVMLDIETLGTEPHERPAVIEIGAVAFDASGLRGREFGVSVGVESCVEHGLTVDDETLAWWQDRARAAAVLDGGRALPVALEQLTEWCHDRVASEVWANSPAFDCSILAAAYDAVNGGLEPPWKYYETRDLRTLKSLAGDRWPDDLARRGAEHDALADAKHQARQASVALNRVGAGAVRAGGGD